MIYVLIGFTLKIKSHVRKDMAPCFSAFPKEEKLLLNKFKAHRTFPCTTKIAILSDVGKGMRGYFHYRFLFLR